MLLSKSAAAMQSIRIAGALYLLYLGIQRLRDASRGEGDVAVTVKPATLGKIYRDGVVVNVLNPKTSLFFLH